MAVPPSSRAGSSYPGSSPVGDEQAPAGQGFRTGLTVLFAVALLIVALSLNGGEDGKSSHSSAMPASPRAAAPAAPASPVGQPVGTPLPPSRPTRLLIPKISVDAPFTELVLGPDGHLQPPPAGDTNLVGWYGKGPSPGETGTSIIAGHVDTTTSAAVFARLSELEKGDVFKVVRADGRTASFMVDDVETFAKDNFPNERVYGDTPQAQVRLITCAGTYNHIVRDYMDNLVVFAHLM